MAFIPQKGSLRLVSAAEDMTVKVWDLVLGSEIATIRGGSSGRATCFAFSSDYKTLMIGFRDGSISFFNTQKEFQMMHELKCDTSLGFVSDEEEVNALIYLNFNSQTSYLAVAVSSGRLAVIDLSTMQPCYHEDHADYIKSETTHLFLRKKVGSPLG